MPVSPAPLSWRGERRSKLGRGGVAENAAADLDTLPFRADSRINGIIFQAAREAPGPGLVFFAAAAAREFEQALLLQRGSPVIQNYLRQALAGK